VGDALAVDRDNGWECLGIEVSEEAADVARSRGLDVITADAASDSYPDREFDRVRCWHTLEHVHDPLLLLTRLRAAVKPTGTISLIVPNRQSFTSTVFGRYWYHLDLPRHLHHFAPTDIHALAQATGLAVPQTRHTAAPSGLLGSLDILALQTLHRDPRLRSRNALRNAIRALTWALAKLRLADVVEYTLVMRADHADQVSLTGPD